MPTVIQPSVAMGYRGFGTMGPARREMEERKFSEAWDALDPKSKTSARPSVAHAERPVQPPKKKTASIFSHRGIWVRPSTVEMKISNKHVYDRSDLFECDTGVHDQGISSDVSCGVLAFEFIDNISNDVMHHYLPTIDDELSVKCGLQHDTRLQTPPVSESPLREGDLDEEEEAEEEEEEEEEEEVEVDDEEHSADGGQEFAAPSNSHSNSIASNHGDVLGGVVGGGRSSSVVSDCCASAKRACAQRDAYCDTRPTTSDTRPTTSGTVGGSRPTTSGTVQQSSWSGGSRMRISPGDWCGVDLPWDDSMMTTSTDMPTASLSLMASLNNGSLEEAGMGDELYSAMLPPRLDEGIDGSEYPGPPTPSGLSEDDCIHRLEPELDPLDHRPSPNMLTPGVGQGILASDAGDAAPFSQHGSFADRLEAQLRVGPMAKFVAPGSTIGHQRFTIEKTKGYVQGSFSGKSPESQIWPHACGILPTAASPIRSNRLRAVDSIPDQVGSAPLSARSPLKSRCGTLGRSSARALMHQESFGSFGRGSSIAANDVGDSFAQIVDPACATAPALVVYAPGACRVRSNGRYAGIVQRMTPRRKKASSVICRGTPTIPTGQQGAPCSGKSVASPGLKVKVPLTARPTPREGKAGDGSIGCKAIASAMAANAPATPKLAGGDCATGFQANTGAAASTSAGILDDDVSNATGRYAFPAFAGALGPDEELWPPRRPSPVETRFEDLLAMHLRGESRAAARGTGLGWSAPSALPPLPRQANATCPFSHQPIDSAGAIELRCGHRFALERLSQARDAAQKCGAAGQSVWREALICPLCGDLDTTTMPGASNMLTTYSKNTDAYLGSLRKDWQKPLRLPQQPISSIASARIIREEA